MESIPWVRCASGNVCHKATFSKLLQPIYSFSKLLPTFGSFGIFQQLLALLKNAPRKWDYVKKKKIPNGGTTCCDSLLVTNIEESRNQDDGFTGSDVQNVKTFAKDHANPLLLISRCEGRLNCLYVLFLAALGR